MRLWLVKIQLAMFTFSSISAFLNGYKMIAYFLSETVLAARKPKVLLKTSTRPGAECVGYLTTVWNSVIVLFSINSYQVRIVENKWLNF